MLQERAYQEYLIDSTLEAYRHVNNVLLSLPTGGGKTVIFCRLISRHQGYSMAIAHRSELIGQMAMTLARHGIEFSIIAPHTVLKWICMEQVREFGRHYYNPTAKCTVASVRSLKPRYKHILDRVTLWVIDEAHHVLRENEWGRALRHLPATAKGLGVTATPLRLDGAGLGLHTDGVFETLIEGPNMRQLIDAGYLSDYKIVEAKISADYSRVKRGKDGDYLKKGLKEVSRSSPQIIGDIVGGYLSFAAGQRGVTFATDVETAEDIAAEYRRRGVPAKMVCGNTPAPERQQAIRDLRDGRLLQLVNVDLFGEGVDLPTIFSISMASATCSYSRYAQQFGRCLRTAEGKTHGLIIDHVGNVAMHGLPDYGRAWTLDRIDVTEKRAKDINVQPTRVCTNCSAVFLRYKTACPYCGHIYTPQNRSKPEFVDGDLTLLDPEVLAAMRQEVQRINVPGSAVAERMLQAGASPAAAYGAASQHEKRRKNQGYLREVMDVWNNISGGGREGMMKFYHVFGIDTLSAQALGSPGAKELTSKVMEDICTRLNQTCPCP